MRLRKSIIFWAAVAVLLSGVAARYLIWQPKFVPTEFIQARQRGINVSQAIARLTSDSLVDLSTIGGLEQTGRPREAVGLVTKALEANNQARQQALQLSATLETMAKKLPEISPARARDRAAEALGYEVTLINHLITYNEYLHQLLETVEKKLSSGGADEKNGDSQISYWLNLINDETDAINMLNKKFNVAMEEFDRLTAVK